MLLRTPRLLPARPRVPLAPVPPLRFTSCGSGSGAAHRAALCLDLSSSQYVGWRPGLSLSGSSHPRRPPDGGGCDEGNLVNWPAAAPGLAGPRFGKLPPGEQALAQLPCAILPVVTFWTLPAADCLSFCRRSSCSFCCARLRRASRWSEPRRHATATMMTAAPTDEARMMMSSLDSLDGSSPLLVPLPVRASVALAWRPEVAGGGAFGARGGGTRSGVG